VSADRATLEIELVADPALLATARLFAAAAARAAGCDDDVVEDVRLAVSEACARAMRGAVDGDRIGIDAHLGLANVAFVVEGPRGPAADDDIDGLDLVAALFPSATTSADGRRATIRFDAPAGSS
jgi:anti-sigma regulatory factor (Ser/Thr protein kinase)